MADTQVLNISPDGVISAKDFLGFGVGEVAYVRTVRVMNKPMFAIHAADGTPISVFDSEDAALQALDDHNLDPVRVH